MFPWASSFLFGGGGEAEKRELSSSPPRHPDSEHEAQTKRTKTSNSPHSLALLAAAAAEQADAMTVEQAAAPTSPPRSPPKTTRVPLGNLDVSAITANVETTKKKSKLRHAAKVLAEREEDGLIFDDYFPTGKYQSFEGLFTKVNRWSMDHVGFSVIKASKQLPTRKRDWKRSIQCKRAGDIQQSKTDNSRPNQVTCKCNTVSGSCGQKRLKMTMAMSFGWPVAWLALVSSSPKRMV
jgi:hypothetical protein